jgi:hypothetical protein
VRLRSRYPASTTIPADIPHLERQPTVIGTDRARSVAGVYGRSQPAFVGSSSARNPVQERSPMAFSIYQASVPAYIRRLEALSAILDKAASHTSQGKIEPAALLHARLYPDMLPLARQVQIACSHAVRGATRLSGAEPASVEDKENSFDDLKTLITETLVFLKTVDPKKMEGMEDREITYPVGDKKMTVKGADYLLHFSMPNFYFHVTTAYAILRNKGLDIGKDDFMGKA